MQTTQRRSSMSYKMSAIASIPGLPARSALATGSKHRATVSYVHDPAKFFVQFADEQQTLLQLHDSLASFYRECSEQCSLAIGTLVMTPLQEVASQGAGETVHRAIIESIWDNQQMALVRFIDIGGSVNVLTNLLKPLPGPMQKIAPFALQCGLHGMKSTGYYSEHEISKFFNMFFDDSGREFTLMGTVVEKGFQLVHILGDDGQNLTHVYRSAIFKQAGAAITESFPMLPAPVDERRPRATVVTGYRRQSPKDLEGKILPVVIVEATSPSKFIINPRSMQAVDGDELVEQLHKLNKQMTAYYNSLSPNELRVECAVLGMPVAALFSIDKCWYRAEVIGVRSEMLTVRFVDYGNVVEVSLASEEGLRQLLPVYLDQLDAVAIDASLKDVRPVDGSRAWSSDSIEFMKQLVGKSLTCRFLGRSADAPTTTYVELLDSNVERDQVMSVVAELTRRKLAVRVAEETFENGRPSSVVTGHTHSFPRQAQKIGVAEMGTIIDSSDPNNISVQMASANNQLLMMSDRLSAVYADPASAPPVIRFPLVKRQMCVAQFTIDQQWYRAEVLQDVDVGPIPVRFVDYGNCAACHPSQVREVADDEMLLRTPALSFTVRIAGVNPIIDDVWLIAQDIFDNFVRDSLITLVGIDADGVYRAEFTHKNGSNLSSLFISGNLATAEGGATVNGVHDAAEIPRRTAGKDSNWQRLPCLELSFDIGDFMDVFVTACNEAEKIVFAQPMDFVPRVNALVEEMQKCATDVAKQLDNIVPGMLCAAPSFIDSLWYRAIVMKQKDDANFKVHFVDYGDTATVSKSSLRVLPDKWAQLPALCFPIRVSNELPAVNDVVVIRLEDILHAHNPTRTTAQAHVFKEEACPPSTQAEQQRTN